MAAPGRTPPRFVPTLTVVVEPPAAAVSPVVAAEEPPPAAPGSVPFVPATQIALSTFAEEDANAHAFRLEEELLHRVLQRIDLGLEQRMTETVSAAVQEQLDAMLPRLRAEIEQLLRALVIEALAQELAVDTRPYRRPPP